MLEENAYFDLFQDRILGKEDTKEKILQLERRMLQKTSRAKRISTQPIGEKKTLKLICEIVSETPSSSSSRWISNGPSLTSPLFFS